MAIALSFISVQNDNQAESLDARRRFSAMTQAGTQAWPRYQIALLTTQDEDDRFITEIGTVTRTWAPVANGWHRLIYQRQEDIEPLTVDDLLEEIPARLRGSVEDRLVTGGRLTAKGEAAVVAAFGSLRPQAAKTLRRLLGQQRVRRPRLTGEGLQAAGQEADAVTTALDIAGIPRAELRDTRPDGGSSFVELLSIVRTPEDSAITYDSMRFLDFERLDHPSGIVEFSHNNERLTVINVNRQPLERTTGADLIYINERSQSFVLVQYKSLRREGERPARLVYRPDEQFNAELERMRAIKSGTKGSTHDAFRFHPGCCYLKFCKPISSLDHPPQQLVSGFYLPIEYYDLLAKSDVVQGPRGGIALSYETVPRHVTNEMFVALVRGGWVGSQGATSKGLTEIVLAGLRDGHSVTVAEASQGVADA